MPTISKAKRTITILIIILGTPVLGLLFGWLASLREDPFSDNRAIDVGVGLFLGIAAAIASIILGVVNSYLARKNKNSYPMVGYFIPPALLVAYMLITLILA
jgi:LytS/YehU family sensor histidine kinase